MGRTHTDSVDKCDMQYVVGACEILLYVVCEAYNESDTDVCMCGVSQSK